MANLTEKLNTFTSLVLKDAGQKRDALLKRVEEEHKQKLTETENIFLQKAYDEIQKNIAKAKKDANQRVLHTELDSKKQILLKRENIIAKVMDEVKNKLYEFIKSDKYEKWLLEKTEQSIFEVGRGLKIVYIAPGDLKYKKSIEQLGDGSLTVEAADEKDFMGGVKVYNTDRKVAVDYSFKEMLNEQKSAFLQTSGLSLD